MCLLSYDTLMNGAQEVIKSMVQLTSNASDASRLTRWSWQTNSHFHLPRFVTSFHSRHVHPTTYPIMGLRFFFSCPTEPQHLVLPFLSSTTLLTATAEELLRVALPCCRPFPFPLIRKHIQRNVIGKSFQCFLDMGCICSRISYQKKVSLEQLLAQSLHQNKSNLSRMFLLRLQLAAAAKKVSL